MRDGQREIRTGRDAGLPAFHSIGNERETGRAESEVIGL
jgi:hypothetical protein